jgi:hypothetical protein
MKNFKNIFYYGLSLLIVGVACDSEDDLINQRIADNIITYTEGDADFSNYVAIGNSLTAGLMDAALYTEGQDSAFPNIIGGQLVKAGFATEFNQPDINAVNGYNTSLNTDPNVATFGHFILDTSIPGPIPLTPGDVITAYSGDKTALNNFGVPGATLSDLLTPALAANGLYARFATNPGVSTVLGDALATNPTFYTLWIGNNDVLSYALSGGQGDDPLVTYTDAQFFTDYSSVIGQLAGAGAKGVVINIPPVLLIPFFRAVDYDVIELDQASADALNTGLAGVNGAYDGLVASLGHDADDIARRKVSYSAGNNPILVIDEELADLGPEFDILLGVGAISAAERAALVPYEQSRPLVEGELVLLTAGAVLGTEADGDDTVEDTPIGAAVPLGFNLFTGELTGDSYYLTLAEQTAIVTARATYSGVIAGIAAATDGVEMFDVQPIFADAAGLTATDAALLALTADAQAAADGELGINFEGVYIAPDFSPSGMFSTDGIHPNPRGHAILANKLIDFINESFNSDIPKINSTAYRTVLFQ